MNSVLNRKTATGAAKVKVAKADTFVVKAAKMKTSTVMLAALLGSLAASSASAFAADPKITLTPAMVTNETARGNAALLVNEQSAAGNPAAETGGSLSTSLSWNESIGWNSEYYPATAVIDLGATYNITNVSLYDMSDSGTATISKGTPFNWTPVYTQNLDPYYTWDVQATSFQTRYLQVKLLNRSSMIGEIVLNGTLVSTPPPTPTPVSNRVRPLMEKFIGANAFNDDPIDKLKAVGFIREYHNWEWNPAPGALFPNNRNYWNSTPSGFTFDNFYAAAKNAGLEVSPVTQDSITNLLGPTADLANKPIAPGAVAEDPASYAQHADFMFQYAARYGNTPVAQSLLKLHPLESPLTGARLLNWYENWNEEDKDWRGAASYFSPYQMAAMSSADYDGDQGRMGSTFGLKNADPTAKMAIGGLVEINIEYWKAMKMWSDYYRGGSFPGDAINVHWYSSNGGVQGQAATQGISPEADNVRGRYEELVRWRNANLPNVEVWASEFGYDTSQASPIHAPPIGSFSVEEVQAQWIVRTYLAIAAAGVDRAQMFMLRDSAPRDTGGRFETSGLVLRKEDNWAPKVSWYYVSTLTNRLRGMRFDSVVNSGNPNVYVYKFKTPNGSKTAYAVWCPTSNGTTVSNYQLAVGSSISGVSRVDMTPGQANGAATALTASSGNVSLNVSERPTLVITDNIVANATEVTITSPTDGAKFSTSSSFNVTATVAYNSNAITQVAFYSNDVLVGTDTSAPWSVPVSNLAVGVYDLKAVAKDSAGASYSSPLVRVVVPSGTGLTGKYYNGSNFETLAKTQIDPIINFDWGFGAYGGPDTIVDHNAFSVRWTGQIQALESGVYNIGSTFDDAIRITINDGTGDKKVVDRWDSPASTYFVVSGLVNLVAGQKYNISIDYAQRPVSGNGGLAAASLKWIRPGQAAFEVVPQSQLYPTVVPPTPTVGTGLKGQYYTNDNFYGGSVFTNLFKTRTDATINFDWAYGSPDAGMAADNFSVRWTGQVQAVESGLYTFTTTTDDGVRLWANGVLLVDKWQGQGTTAWSGNINLTAGQKYAIKMEYFENGGGAVAKLQWKRPGQATIVPIPQSQLFAAP